MGPASLLRPPSYYHLFPKRQKVPNASFHFLDKMGLSSQKDENQARRCQIYCFLVSETGCQV